MLVPDKQFTFLTTLLVVLFITLGIALINKYEERFHKYTDTINSLLKKDSEIAKIHEKLIEETESLRLIDRLFPHIISMYMLSSLLPNKEKTNNQQSNKSSKKNEEINSICYKIERHISSNKSNFENLLLSGNIDDENKKIFINYLDDTADNLDQHNLGSEYAQDIINKIVNIRDQINELKPINFKENTE